ncbi:MAG: hypothetical protein GX312_02375 [Candidatus Phytoplasma sp.]|nr:hypothetical protein [Phytoplasma sp.]
MKKYRVSLEISIFIMCYFILSIAFFILLLFFNLLKEEFSIIVIYVFMWVIFPLILLITIINMMWPIIIINDEGIQKYLFGKLKRSILWEEVKSVKLLGGYKQWLFISKSELTTKSLTIARRKKDSIYIYVKKDIIEDLERYIPESIDNLNK